MYIENHYTITLALFVNNTQQNVTFQLDFVTYIANIEILDDVAINISTNVGETGPGWRSFNFKIFKILSMPLITKMQLPF